MQDQLKWWDDAHNERRLQDHSQSQTAFAEEVVGAVSKSGHLLEIGCGVGNDSLYFAEHGFDVVATDFSAVAIADANQRLKHKNLKFSVLDVSQPINYEDGSFDIVYARLSLHYFPDATTRAMFKELSRVLRPGSYLCFMCKSVDDPLYNQGEKLEKDMFELNGHVRHFFSEQYTRGLLADNDFAVLGLKSGTSNLYDRESAFVQVIAQKNS